MKKMFLFRYADLMAFVVQNFMRLDVPGEDARIAASIILEADLRGVHTHGIIRISTYYIPWLQKKYISPLASLKTVSESITSISLDGGNGLGHVIGFRSMQKCLEKARSSGVGIATVRNSNHFGIAGYYAMMALEQDMIGVSLTNSSPWVAPTYAKKRMVGTNPIALAVPAGKERPFVLDMATSVVSQGLVVLHDKRKEPIPSAWGVDSNGVPTTDPGKVLEGGALNPLGGTDLMRSYKGYGLGMFVDILSGVLSGAGFGGGVSRPGSEKNANVGHFFAAIRVDQLRPLDVFKQDMDQLIRQLKESPRAEGQDRVYIPGEKEYERADLYMRDGVPVYEEIVALLQQTGRENGVAFDLSPLGEKLVEDKDSEM